MDRLTIAQLGGVNDAVTLALKGELDVHSSSTLETRLDSLLDDSIGTVVLDLANVTFVDSVGMRVLVALHRQLAERGGQVVLRSPSTTVARALHYAGLDEHLTIEDREEP